MQLQKQQLVEKAIPNIADAIKTVVSQSENKDFRTKCLNLLKVRVEGSLSLFLSLRPLMKLLSLTPLKTSITLSTFLQIKDEKGFDDILTKKLWKIASCRLNIKPVAESESQVGALFKCLFLHENTSFHSIFNVIFYASQVVPKNGAKNREYSEVKELFSDFFTSSRHTLSYSLVCKLFLTFA